MSIMSKNLLDNGTILTLGLVGAVAAIGVAAKRGVYGSRATRGTKINSVPRLMSALNAMGFSLEAVPRSRIRAQLVGGNWIRPSILEDRTTDRNHTHIAFRVKGDVVDFALGEGASTDTFNIGNVTGIIGGILQDALKNDVALHRMEDGLLVNDENGISIRIEGDEAEIMQRVEDADGNLKGMKDIGTFRVSDIQAIRASLPIKKTVRQTKRQTLLQNYRAVGQQAVKAGIVPQHAFNQAMATIGQHSDAEIKKDIDALRGAIKGYRA